MVNNSLIVGFGLGMMLTSILFLVLSPYLATSDEKQAIQECNDHFLQQLDTVCFERKPDYQAYEWQNFSVDDLITVSD